MFTGSLVALITPMDSKGNVDHVSLKKLVEYHIANGTSAIVSVGTTGESATLDHHEHIDVIKRTVDYAQGRINIIAGTGSNATKEAIELTRQVENIGVVGCLTVAPYYNKPTQEGMYQHFKAIAECTALPQILYNVPGRTSSDIKPETVGRLSKIKNIVALKDATGDLSRVYKTRKLVGDDFKLLSGDDATFLDFMILGGDGVISVTANVAAKQVATVCQLAANNQIKEARALNESLLALHNNLFIEPNPTPAKWACLRLGLIADGTIRLPMISLTDASIPAMEQALKDANLL
ncbi:MULTISPECIES: 4-hydroxy-tetrahydrodipicolinate synthase [unclassified Gilliamella]|uniref:4-hydroxy-tetrahydrodipicolinate synthase n=1 Tax=unclassified Gilliamella TaxID=2685620 RepID=UPI00226A5DB6|nr:MULTISPECIES: 4-hydroxy-tetrahydrodipicolinate synthase [unclassified Gilliamella]MCX8642251.1 4-hydroxy-tetrahydrodipicolinate synthase [Gilliamella sp. B3835]MCX8707649.1 4-hydroxy-tetrahydrodipicolinate synthase [Gilliamella sp. B3783]MCX8710024.1 4-hydroxy-tetrahydrodipicolinate synthase [Gilliamella sp. B3780]MCX8713492.1 4-hydroxy-tetrahydrodipicolinate synthase [Gilliamella sp. B3781]MCX8716632.1 4-hydroxy-tetrahydrodipicolinate synthase [Gilliamella sp. B3784]